MFLAFLQDFICKGDCLLDICISVISSYYGNDITVYDKHLDYSRSLFSFLTKYLSLDERLSETMYVLFSG